MKILAHVPNFITCLNLICGSLGIILLFQDKAIYAAYLIWLAAVLDFFDGFFARVLKSYSPMGKELDSLADMVSFGILPSFIMYWMIGQSTADNFLPFISLLMAVFSVLRLAKFNIDERQTDTFIGLPTPANALFISSLPIILHFYDNLIQSLLLNSWILIMITVLFSFLLVAELPLFSLKFKNYKWINNKIRFSFLGMAIISLLLFKIMALPFIIIFYIFISILENFNKKEA